MKKDVGEKRQYKKNSHLRLDILNNILPKHKRSQITIFIILGIVIIIVILVLFFGKSDFASLFLVKSPVDKIRDCSRESLINGIDILSLQGGVINPVNYYMYKGNKLEYVCYTEESFQKCVMQKPLLKNIIESELENYLKPRIKECLTDVKSSVERSGKTFSYKDPVINVELSPDIVVSDIELELNIKKEDISESYKNIKANIDSNLYKLVIIAGEIANTEAKYGDADITGFMFKDKKIKVEKIKQGDETKVYILTDRESGKKLMFAVKSIPIPPGWIEPEKFEK